jgi:antitoxin component of MazEF toxin-antitoxin module
MDKQQGETRKLRLDRPLMKMGGSLVVTLPNEVIQEWNLSKGDEVTLEVLDGAVRIEPKQPAKIATISEASLEEYSKVMKGIQAKITMDPEAATLHVELLGADRKSVSTVLNNLWRNLPFLLSMLGLGSVEAPEPGARRRKVRKYDKATIGRPPEQDG